MKQEEYKALVQAARETDLVCLFSAQRLYGRTQRLRVLCKGIPVAVHQAVNESVVLPLHARGRNQ